MAFKKYIKIRAKNNVKQSKIKLKLRAGNNEWQSKNTSKLRAENDEKCSKNDIKIQGHTMRLFSPRAVIIVLKTNGRA
jgi:ribosomal protein S4E